MHVCENDARSRCAAGIKITTRLTASSALIPERGNLITFSIPSDGTAGFLRARLLYTVSGKWQRGKTRELGDPSDARRAGAGIGASLPWGASDSSESYEGDWILLRTKLRGTELFNVKDEAKR